MSAMKGLKKGKKKRNHQYIWLGDAPGLRTAMCTNLESSFSRKAPELTFTSLHLEWQLSSNSNWLVLYDACWLEQMQWNYHPHPIYPKHVKQRNSETIWQGPACSCGTAYYFCTKLLKMFRHYAKRPMSILLNFCSQIYLNDTDSCSLVSVIISYIVILWTKKKIAIS